MTACSIRCSNTGYCRILVSFFSFTRRVGAVHLHRARLHPFKCTLLILMFIFPSYSSLMKEGVGTVVEHIFSIITKDREGKVMFTFLKTVFCY